MHVVAAIGNAGKILQLALDADGILSKTDIYRSAAGAQVLA
jgi:hypothetical protein